jgi:hypothetical protein
MQKIIRYISLLSIFLTLSVTNSCSLFKKEGVQSKKVIVKNVTSLQKQMEDNYISFTTLEVKSKIKLQEPKSINLKSIIRFTKNENIWISASFMGIEGMRMKIDSEGIQALDKLNKKHYVLNFQKWNKKYNTDFNLSHFENLLLGRVILPINKDSKINSNSNLYTVTSPVGKEEFWLQYILDGIILKQQRVWDSKNTLSVQMEYSEQKLDDILPIASNLATSGKTRILADFTHYKTKIDKEFSSSFSVSSKYETIEL